jgi:hypothetical protein
MKQYFSMHRRQMMTSSLLGCAGLPVAYAGFAIGQEPSPDYSHPFIQGPV